MADRFFTARNSIDKHLGTLTASQSEIVLEAVVRRLASQVSPRTAAVKLYRLADICAVEELDPFKIKKPRHWLVRFFNTISWSYWTGLAVGFWMGSTWR